MITTFRRLVRPVLSVDRLLLVWGLVLGIVAAGCAAGLLALAGWFLAMCAAAGGGLALTFSYLFPSGGVRALAVGRVGTRYLERLVTHRVSLDAAVQHRTALFRHAGARVSSPPRDRANPSARVTSTDLLTRLTTDVDSADGILIRVLSPVLSTLAVSGAVVGLLALIDWRAAAVAGAGALTLTVVGIAAAEAGLSEGRAASTALHRFRARLVEMLTAAPELASYHLEQLAIRELLPRLELHEQHRRRRRAWTATAEAVAPAGALAVGVLNAAIVSSYVHGPTRVASLAAVAFATIAVIELSQSLPVAWSAYGDIRDAGRRLDEVSLLTDEDTVLAEETMPTGAPLPASGLRETPLARDASPTLLLEELSFRRGSADIDKITVRLDGTATLLVTGPSGSGKSTLLGLLTGGLAPQTGRVRLQGRDPMTVSSTERSSLIVAVEQQPLHVTGTIADNLRLARADATDAELEELLRRFWLDRNGGLSIGDMVTAGGQGLSGGQRRRLAIARAVLKRPAVLALDEPTEGLDHATAVATLSAVRSLLPAAVLVLVMHDRNLRQLPGEPESTVSLIPGWERRRTNTGLPTSACPTTHLPQTGLEVPLRRFTK